MSLNECMIKLYKQKMLHHKNVTADIEDDSSHLVSSSRRKDRSSLCQKVLRPNMGICGQVSGSGRRFPMTSLRECATFHETKSL